MSVDKQEWSEKDKKVFQDKVKALERADSNYQIDTHSEHYKGEYTRAIKNLEDYVKELVRQNKWPDLQQNDKVLGYFRRAQRQIVEDDKKKDEEAKLKQRDSIPPEVISLFEQILQLEKKIEEHQGFFRYYTEQVRQSKLEQIKMEKRIELEKGILEEKNSELEELKAKWGSIENNEFWESILRPEHQIQWESVNRLLTLVEHFIESKI